MTLHELVQRPVQAELSEAQKEQRMRDVRRRAELASVDEFSAREFLRLGPSDLEWLWSQYQEAQNEGFNVRTASQETELRRLRDAIDVLRSERERLEERAYHRARSRARQMTASETALREDLADLLGRHGIRRDEEEKKATPAKALELAIHAVRYVLDRAQTDPDLGYLIGRGMRSFELLTEAEAAFTGEDLKKLRDARAKDAQPEHARRKAEVVRQTERAREFEALLCAHNIPIPEHLQS